VSTTASHLQLTASQLRLTEFALQGRLYSVSVSSVDYAYPRKLSVDSVDMEIVGCHRNVSVNICCRGNRCLSSHCLAMDIHVTISMTFMHDIFLLIMFL
jgi:hypothetical protein